MPSKVILPKFGQTVEVSEITQWTKPEGALIRKGDVLCEIATDKSSLEVESPYDGTLLKIILPIKQSAPVGCVIAVLGAPGEVLSDAFLAECVASLSGSGATSAAAPPIPQPPAMPTAAPSVSVAPPVAARAAMAQAAAAVAPPPAPAAPAPAPRLLPPGAPARIFVSPRARRLAQERDVPLEVLNGSGEHGRITTVDVQAYLQQVGPVSPTARVAALEHGVDLRVVRQEGTAGRIMLDHLTKAAPAAPAVEPLPALQARSETASPMRRAIAAAMLASNKEIPAFALEATIEAGALIEARAAQKKLGVAVGYGDYIARAVALAIHRHPQFAAQWRDGTIAYLDRVHIAFAVSIPGGLVTPVVTDCDLRSVAEISAASAVLVEKARTGKLKSEEYSGAVFTLSNLGGFPIDRFTAIVPPGQSGILAIGRIRDEVVAKDGGIFIAKRLSLTLSADHRYIDGADGAKFLTEVKTLLEAPSRL